MKTISNEVERMLSSAFLREFVGEAWLLEQEAVSTKMEVKSIVALAVWRGRKYEASCGFQSIDKILEEDKNLHELLETKDLVEIEGWREKEFGEEFEGLLDLLREEGTDGLARKLGCTQRRVQQKLKQLLEKEQGLFADDFFGGVV